jgi:3-methyladenine DNA glycosylase AlkC
MAAVKDELSAATAGVLADELRRAWPSFPHDRFVDGIGDALAPLAFSGRVELLADRLGEALPEGFGAAAEVLWVALDSPTFTGWITLPAGRFVATAGIDEPLVALPLLAGLTPRFSSEFAIRPFIERHPAVTFDFLHRWVDDPDEHVRRLVSEGTRPRLPWAPLLRGFVADPSPSLALLDRLHADPSPYVRRSVANHLNDIAKDHPDVALDRARRWLRAGGASAAVVRHGLRTLVKRGDPEALALLGVDHLADIRLVALAVEPQRVVVGGAATLRFTLELVGGEPADAVVDYRVHYVGARGARAPKVFKLTRRRLLPGEPVTISRRHRFEHVSIRTIRPGPHPVDVQVNGRVLGTVTVLVDGADRPGPSGRDATHRRTPAP